MVELIKAPAVPAWPPQNLDKRPRTVRIITTANGTQRAESLSEIADAEKITFDALINLNFGVRKGDPSGDQWARINLERANDLYKKDYQVLMLVTGSILDGNIRVTPWTTHVVVLDSPIQFGSDAEGNRTVSFTVFTWAKKKQVPGTGTLKMTDFLQNYFGFNACKF